jgi:hypothetical protein
MATVPSSNATALTNASTLTTNTTKTEDSSKTEIKPEKKNEQQKKNWWHDKNKHYNNHNNKANRAPKESTFKGTITDMNGHTFQCHGEATHASQFSRTFEELQSYCLKTYKYSDDVAHIVRHFKEFDLKSHKPSPAPTDANSIDLRILEKEVDEYVKRSAIYKQNKKALYMVVWAQCSNAMQVKMKSISTFKKFDEERDCLDLLKEIKGVSYKFEAQRYPPLALYEAKSAFFRFQQHKALSNTDYLDKFKALYEVIEHFGGMIGHDPMLIKDEARRNGTSNHANLTETDTEYINNIPAARQRFLAYAFIQGADKTRFGDLLLELENQHTCGNDNFPRDLTGAYNLLVNYGSKHRRHHHHEDEKKSNFAFLTSENGRYVNEEGVKCNSLGVPLKCFKCGGPHYSNDPNCPKNKTKLGSVNNYSKSTLNNTSFPSYSSKQSYNQSKIDYVMALTEIDSNSIGLDRHINIRLEDYNPPVTTSDVCLSIIPLILHNSSWLHDNHIILDTGSTVTLFKNPRLLSDIYCVPNNQALTVYCNSGTQLTTHCGTLPGIGEVWYNESSLANILSFSTISDLFPIHYDQANNTFIIYIDNNNFVTFS